MLNRAAMIRIVHEYGHPKRVRLRAIRKMMRHGIGYKRACQAVAITNQVHAAQLYNLVAQTTNAQAEPKHPR